MEYTREALAELVKQNRPSIRDSVVVLQDLFTEGVAVTLDTIKPANKQFDELYEMLIVKKDWKAVKDVVMSRMVDPRQLNKHFWAKEITSNNPHQKRIQILCNNERTMSQGADGEVIMCTSLIELAK